MTAEWVEPCLWSDDPEQLAAELDAAERAFLDLHGLPADGNPDRYPLIDHGRSPARRHVPHHRPIDDVLEDL
ncbi:hypothetical protein [Streptomyces lavendofoliae]|uniref:Uncharacterized protein n=1 Tax=Streptomyces lavendofoliae TaxID=67314 RepID=A0A918I223_9ACTN|nr:hypothetical protein [Streptomyces lavendofoliae]GGU52320.1 hypothetical protein GCM10010274_46540 [Streptomyces lavendofoliae]